jgi:hypothetical protein
MRQWWRDESGYDLGASCISPMPGALGVRKRGRRARATASGGCRQDDDDDAHDYGGINTTTTGSLASGIDVCPLLELLPQPQVHNCSRSVGLSLKG